jgi:hypothetical protein
LAINGFNPNRPQVGSPFKTTANQSKGASAKVAEMLQTLRPQPQSGHPTPASVGGLQGAGQANKAVGANLLAGIGKAHQTQFAGKTGGSQLDASKQQNYNLNRPAPAENVGRRLNFSA